jgi:hypothetical protein
MIEWALPASEAEHNFVLKKDSEKRIDMKARRCYKKGNWFWARTLSRKVPGGFREGAWIGGAQSMRGLALLLWTCCRSGPRPLAGSAH